MKKLHFLAALSFMSLHAAAQDTYENAKIATEDLNGTARYVAMGGAMDALGADISTISSNPAGLGLFRKSNANFTVGISSQQDAKNFGGGHATHMVFDQVGFVWVNQISNTDFVNFAFNYHMSHNFNHILSVADRLPRDANGDPYVSQNRITYEKQMEGLLYAKKSDGVTPDFGYDPSYMCTQLDQVYMEKTDLVWDGTTMGYYGATDYSLNRATKGYIGNYDFALSGNVQNMFYWGVTIGLQDVKYRHYGEYRENYATLGNYNLRVLEDRSIDGTGFNLKVGAIFRPIEESPFRFGVSIATPTWYDLKSDNVTTMVSSNSGERVPFENFSHKFKLNTPWKFGLSAGHTIDNMLAIGIGYEYTDYTAIDTRYDDGDYYYSSSHSDEDMNRLTERTMKGVSTFKIGTEYRPIPEMAFRMGYNYVSPMYEKNAFKDQSVESPGTSVSTTTDFTNWDATHRVSLGLGYQLDRWNIAFTYLYTIQKGTFEPFYYEALDNPNNYVSADKVNINHKRNHFQMTIGYTF